MTCGALFCSSVRRDAHIDTMSDVITSIIDVCYALRMNFHRYTINAYSHIQNSKFVSNRKKMLFVFPTFWLKVISSYRCKHYGTARALGSRLIKTAVFICSKNQTDVIRMTDLNYWHLVQENLFHFACHAYNCHMAFIILFANNFLFLPP